MKNPVPEHNRPMRRLMRRLPFEVWPTWYGTAFALLAFAPAVCVLAALLPGTGIRLAGQIARWVWFLSVLASVPIGAVVVACALAAPQPEQRRKDLGAIASVTVLGAIMSSCLAIGRVDIAIYLNYGFEVLRQAGLPTARWKDARWDLAVLNAGVCLTFGLGIAWIAASLAMGIAFQSSASMVLGKKRPLVRRMRDVLADKPCFGDEIHHIVSFSDNKPGLDEVREARKLAEAGRIEDAVAMALAGIKRRRAGAEMALGQIYEEHGDFEDALLYYERAARRAFERAYALDAAGMLLSRMEDYPEAAIVLEQAIRLGHSVRPANLDILADCLKCIGRNEEAADAEALASELRAGTIGLRPERQ